VTRFRIPSNGYEENVGEAWLWCLLSGPIYFAAKGICFHAATSLLLAIGTGGISWFIYPFFANWSVRKHYLRNGWVPEKDEPRDTDAKSNRGEPGAGSTLFDTLFITAVTAAGALASTTPMELTIAQLSARLVVQLAIDFPWRT